MARIGRIAFILLFLAWGAGARADDDSAAIQQGLETAIKQHAEIAGHTLYSIGDIRVDAQDGGYNVTVTDVRVLPDASGYLGVGDVAFRLDPQGSDRYRVSALRLAPSMPYQRSDGISAGGLSLPVDRFEGVWSVPLGNLIELEAGWRDVKIVDSDGATTLTLGEVSTGRHSADWGDGTWDQQGSWRIANLRAEGREGTLTVGALEMESSSTDVKLAELAAMQSQFWELAEHPEQPPSTELFDAMVRLMRLFGATDGTIRLRDVAFHDTKGGEVFGLPELSLELQGEDLAGGNGRLAMLLQLAGLHATGEGGTLDLGSAQWRSVSRRFDIAALMQIEAKLLPLAMKPEQPPGPALFQAMKGLAATLGDGEGEIDLRNVHFHGPSGGELFALAEGSIASRMDGLSTPVARLGLSYRHRGLDAMLGNPTAQQFLPRDLSLGIAVTNLPAAQLWDRMVDTFSAVDMSKPEESEMASIAFASLLRQMLVQAKARMRLSDWHMDSAAAGVDLEGDVQASPDSPVGGIGMFRIDVRGLDKVIATARAMTPPGEQGGVAGLEVLRGFSNRSKTADGTVLDHYDVEMTPKGALMINGKEFSALGSPSSSPN